MRRKYKKGAKSNREGNILVKKENTSSTFLISCDCYMKASRPGEHDVLSLFSEPEPSHLGWNGREVFLCRNYVH